MDQLKTLLGLAARGTSDPLVDTAEDPGALDRLLTELCAGRAESGALLIETVSDPKSSLGVLRGVKELAKQLAQLAPTPAHRQAATLLYHGAVAAAAGRHGANLSSQPLAERLDLWLELAALLSDSPLGAVFGDAVASDIR